MNPERVDDPDDPRLADYRQLTDPAGRTRYEDEHGVFIVESPLAVEALARSPHAGRTRSVLVGDRRLERMAPTLARLAGHGATVLTAPAAVLEATTGFALHRGVVAAVDRPPAADPDALLAGARTVLAVEAVNDHENLGVLFRNAAAFGVDAVLLDPTCADPWYRRSVRVSMGHVLHVPHARATTWPGPLVDRAAAGWRVLALTPGGTTLAHEVAVGPDERAVVVVGAEGPGLAAATLAAPGLEAIRIAMAPGVDSLNVATAAAVALSHLRGPHLG